ncbi:M1 family metallopeptidase [Fulvivirga maritima]|uniref:M1 family metallopeptidase n=1 Tax=Fulvivirga maritima TaxID=2904247 RepID=UPI001F18DBB0|nr:M1 family metallopeptidase [Fulvivirga maritima]UII27474.1 M1 family metallopeptidase [Fulvivirga maritima]
MKFKTLILAKALALIFILNSQQGVLAQSDSLRTHVHGRVYSPFITYQATADKVNDLIDTKLEVSFDYEKAYLYGKEWVTLTPHFYPTDSLILDAKGMDIHELALIKGDKKTPLKYSYDDGLQLHIKLDQTYTRNDQYTLYIAYTAKPNELTLGGGSAIVDSKGLYFINPKGTNPNKPIQVWTQGETTQSSCWFPTIDHPNQKTTEQIAMTVPSKYVSLSNGELINQKENNDGTRTDTWKMDEPHSPYLFMMAVGDFKIHHDEWKGKPVDYYLEPAYAPYAEDIFGDTPEMISLFSDLLGVDYPWNKYAQIVVRDYVSGAMENTTATLHGEHIQKTPRELLDGSAEETICHELFHQWFGDYVTTESWSNITLNESFADYSETLWDAHKHGQDAGDEKNYNDMLSYMQLPAEADHDLVNFYYNDPLEMFDLVSYPKGGRILHMLRHYVGDEAFFASLKEYLNTYKHSNAEAHQLRLVFEKVTGKDLTWFWNQWYYGKGYPELDVNYIYNDEAKTAQVVFNQTQQGDKIYRLPMKIDIYSADGSKSRMDYQLDAKKDTLTISYPTGAKPALIDVDAEKILLAKITDHKSLSQFIYSYNHAGIYVTRRQAIEYAAQHQDNKEAVDFLITALDDPYFSIRELTIAKLDLTKDLVAKKAVKKLKKIAQNDEKTVVQAAALSALAPLKDKSNKKLFLAGLKSPSYSVEAAALEGLFELDPKLAYENAVTFKDDHLSVLTNQLAVIFATEGNTSDKEFFKTTYSEASLFNSLRFMEPYTTWLAQVDEAATVKECVNQMYERLSTMNNVRFIGYGVHFLDQLQQAKQDDTEVLNFINTKISQLQQKAASLQ